MFYFAVTTLTENVQISLISAVSGISIAFIVNVLAKRVNTRKQNKEPKDRMEQMFDGYERLIKQKDIEDDRKQRYIKLIEEELEVTQKRVKLLEQELGLSRENSIKLRIQLDEMRKEYKDTKGEKYGE